MNSIIYKNADNIEGIKQLIIVPVSEISILPIPLNGSIFTLPLKNNANIYLIEFQNAEMQIQNINSEKGNLFQTTIKGLLQNPQLNEEKVFEELKTLNYIILTKDFNDKERIIGTLNQSPSIEYTIHTNRIEFEINYNSKKTPLFINQTIDEFYIYIRNYVLPDGVVIVQNGQVATTKKLNTNFE